MATQAMVTRATQSCEEKTQQLKTLLLTAFVDTMKLGICLTGLGLDGVSVLSVLEVYNQAAQFNGCRILFERHVNNSGVTATRQFPWLSVEKKAQIIAKNPDKGQLVFVVKNDILFLASIGDEEPLTVCEIQLLCDAINIIHGPGSASVVTTP